MAAGVAVPAAASAAPGVVDVWVSEVLTPDCSAAVAFWLAVACALFADSTAVPGALCAVSPPAAAGVPEEPESVLGGVVVVVAGAGVPASRSPVAILVKRMPVPAAARSSCDDEAGHVHGGRDGLAETHDLGEVGPEGALGVLRTRRRGLRGVEARLLLGHLVAGLRGLLALGAEKQEPVARQHHQGDQQHEDLAVALREGHDPPPRDAGTRVAPRGTSVAGGVGLKVTVTSYL